MGDTVRFWFDVSDPWSYLASEQLPALVAEAGAALVFRPVVCEPVAEVPPARAAMQRIDLERSAAMAGIGLSEVWPDRQRAQEATRRLATHPGLQQRAPEVLREVWAQGLDPLEVVGEPGPVHADVGAAADEVQVFATPSFTVGDTTIWGADRLHRLRQALGLPASVPLVPAAAEGATWEWFHDFASPFSYLASTQIQRLTAGLGIAPTVSPILLGALFREIGTPMIPLHSFPEAQRAWALRDMAAWARWWGVPLRFPSTFPLRTVAALRVSLLAPGATAAIYQAAWVDDRDIGDPIVLRGVLDDAGLDGAELLEQASDPRIKQQLRDNTERARALGICGVPSFRIDDDALVWGQDRLDHVVRLVGGWRRGA